MNKIELLAPAGDLEKLKYAIHYGADAVYMGGEIFGMRQNAKNFTKNDMVEALDFAHSRGKKVYLTLNIIPHDKELDIFDEYINEIKELGFDAYIVADPGTFYEVKRLIPDAEIHISTQANTTNYRSAMFWHDLGAKRIVLAREMNLEEISSLKSNISDEVDIEAFVHGAMCMSYSGRCLISSFFNAKSANKGACTQPCRWKYALVEEKRDGEFYPIEEDENGTYFFNSKDLCTIDILDDIIKSGVNSLKIEGRSKTLFYVASVTRVYRKALDEYLKSPSDYVYNPEWFEELCKISYRGYTHGFFLGNPQEEGQNYENSSYIKNFEFLGTVLDYDKDTKLAKIEQRGRFFVGDEIEFIGPDYRSFKQKIEIMWDKNMNEIEVANKVKMIVYIKTDFEVFKMDILRKDKLQKSNEINECDGCEFIN